MAELSPQQARQALKANLLARTTLTGYARYIDIPGVPDDTDGDDREFMVVETPLALHHIVLLNALQLVSQGLLLYDRESMTSPVSWPVLRGEKPQGNQTLTTGAGAEPPTGVESMGGSDSANACPPHQFQNPQNLPPHGKVTGTSYHETGSRPCEAKDSSSSRDDLETCRTTGDGSTDCESRTPCAAPRRTNTEPCESELPNLRGRTQSQRPRTLPAGSSDVPSAMVGSTRSGSTDPFEHPQVLAAFEGVLTGRISPEDCRKLVDEVAPGLDICRRVMIMEPPGSAKSTYASVVFPTWVMGREKAFETILTGWGDPICKRHGKRARQICQSPQYRALFGVNVDPNTRAAEDWQLANGSSYKSSGITAGISGFRAHGLVWDDLIRGRKDADSQTIRNDVWNEYVDSARSRKTPSAWEVGIGTRWHEDEHMGRILPEGYNGQSGFMECRDGNVWYA